MHLLFGPIFVFFLAFAAGPIGICQTLFVCLVEVTTGLLAGILAVFVGARLKVVRTAGARYCIGAMATAVGAYLAFTGWHPYIMGLSGDWASFGEMMAAGISFWLGVLVGGPVQLLIRSVTDNTPVQRPVPSAAMFTDFEGVDLKEERQDSLHMRMLAIRSRT
jgi:hypothetical protein